MMQKGLVVLSLLALPLAAQAADLAALLDAGQVRLEEVRGTGYSTGTSLDVVVRNTSGRDLEIDTVPSEALFFKNQGDGTHMLVLGLVERSGGYYEDDDGNTFVELPRNKKLDMGFLASSVEFDRPEPSSGETLLRADMPPYLQRISELLRHIEKVGFEQELEPLDTIQLALWLYLGMSLEEIEEEYDFAPKDVQAAEEIVRHLLHESEGIRAMPADPSPRARGRRQ